MSEDKQKRESLRFEVPGATVNYQPESFLSHENLLGEDNCPIVNMSRNGLCFMSREELFPDSNINIKIIVPGRDTTLNVRGHIRWTTLDQLKDYKYVIGIEFVMDSIFKGLSASDELAELFSLEETYYSDSNNNNH